MSWRTVVISKRCKLDLRMGFLVLRNEEGTKRIHINEISLLIIENTAVSITGCLLCELAAQKIKVIFCDNKRNPCSELVNYYGSHDSSRKIENQIKWDEYVKKHVWSEIVAEKIRKQSQFLKDIKKFHESLLLDEYVKQVEFADATNREGHAAKVYFNAVFGTDFTRTADNSINAGLNYGYSIILATFNREIVASGYLTQLGIFHNNMFNHFNLSSDLMEPFRILIDRIVFYNEFNIFESAQKQLLLGVLNQKVLIDGKEQLVSNAIRIYCKSIFDAIETHDISLIKFYNHEL
ncbi:MAG: type II CRISPR-associated endonuclease Cas1 [Clostridiales bacterium]|nr:type II CRISPR-associated endonuclease Cas1 [Clostridiales bacterium]